MRRGYARHVRCGGHHCHRSIQCASLHAAGCRQWNGRSRRVPRDDIRYRHFMVQLDIRRRDNRLRTVVRFGRHRDDRLLRQFRLALLRHSRRRAARVNRWQVLRRRVVDHVRLTECGPWQPLDSHCPELAEGPQRSYDERMPEPRLQKSPPRHSPGYEHVGPEWSGTRADQRWQRMAPK